MKLKRLVVIGNWTQEGHLACAAPALPLSYDNQTTTGLHNLYMHQTGDIVACSWWQVHVVYTVALVDGLSTN